MAIKDDILEQIRRLPSREREGLVEELSKGLESPPSNTFDWTRDPFITAEDLCGGILKISADKEYRITDLRGWREMDAKRATQYDIANRQAGTIHAFPLKRYKQKAEGAAKAEPYHILAIVANSKKYPTGLITLNAIALGKENIPATEIWGRIGISEIDLTNSSFIVPGKLELELADARIRVLRSKYDVEGFDQKDVQGYKIPLRWL